VEGSREFHAGVDEAVGPTAASVSRKGSAATSDRVLRGGQHKKSIEMDGSGDLPAPAGSNKVAGPTATTVQRRPSAATTIKHLRGGQQKKNTGMDHYKKMQSESTHNQQFSVGFNRFGKTTPKSRDLCYSNQQSEHLFVGFNRFGKTTVK
jgi:hypothetical protein